MPEFAPSLFKGLGTEVKDIEINKMFKELADTYGTKVNTKQVFQKDMSGQRDVVKMKILETI